MTRWKRSKKKIAINGTERETYISDGIKRAAYPSEFIVRNYSRNKLKILRRHAKLSSKRSQYPA